ncbi:MAG TPA: molybdenum cofactor guanylyltransferase [Longimicrobiales bacterium]|nr:molybdenum cofactor guanylyltransferase [Longimicrobiales bacterium]
MTPAPRLLGAVLAGGEGRRFGGPKAEARLGGISLAERAVALLRTVLDDVVVVTSHDLSAPPAPVVPDRVRGLGPLGGLDAALRYARDRGYEGVLLVGCDLPLLTTALLEEVASGLAGHRAVAPGRRGGGVEPLCAAYRVELSEAVEGRLAQDDRSLHALFRDVGGHMLPGAVEAGDDPFLNVNTVDELERAEAALSGGGDR